MVRQSESLNTTARSSISSRTIALRPPRARSTSAPRMLPPVPVIPEPAASLMPASPSTAAQPGVVDAEDVGRAGEAEEHRLVAGGADHQRFAGRERATSRPRPGHPEDRPERGCGNRRGGDGQRAGQQSPTIMNGRTSRDEAHGMRPDGMCHLRKGPQRADRGRRPARLLPRLRQRHRRRHRRRRLGRRSPRRPGPPPYRSYTQAGGYLGAQQLLARPVRPTAIFAGADVVALGAGEAIAEAGLSIPGDISVAGYDNSALAAFGPISLTSVDQDGRQMGANAARLLVDRIGDRGRRTAQIKLSPTLVTRRTTAAPEQAAP
ncbi:substrate-binding domain-containing protein [Actinoplanes sp. CA-015351]|uniref:substrate-binding domain-containing protein n=1 Tax=Actinoplanes sp. CA-015351 TaxID=3239897 RepID=UPI003D966CB8